MVLSGETCDRMRCTDQQSIKVLLYSLSSGTSPYKLNYLKMGVVRSRKSEARSSMTGSWVSSSSNCLVARAEL